MRFREEDRQRGGCAYGKFGMTRAQAFGGGFLPVAGTVAVAQLCNALSDGRKVTEETFDRLGGLRPLGDVGGGKLELPTG